MATLFKTGGAALRWPSRPRIDESDLARRRIWQSRCGDFRVEHAISHYGLPDVWRVHKRRQDSSGWWDLVSTHRKKRAAFRAAEQAAKKSAEEGFHAKAQRR
jgi:hypothetical protein